MWKFKLKQKLIREKTSENENLSDLSRNWKSSTIKKSSMESGSRWKTFLLRRWFQWKGFSSRRSIKSAKIIKRVIFLMKTNRKRDAAERINLFSIKRFFLPLSRKALQPVTSSCNVRVKATDGGVTFYKTIICQPESFLLAMLKSSRRSDSAEDGGKADEWLGKRLPIPLACTNEFTLRLVSPSPETLKAEDEKTKKSQNDIMTLREN